jgi:uncharacterized protein YbjT (DUF2867 family)
MTSSDPETVAEPAELDPVEPVPAAERRRCLVTGATGYVGSRLAPRLVAEGHDVVVLARTPAKLDRVPWRDRVTVLEGDLDDPASVRAAMTGVDVVYHLVHSMGGHDDFRDQERRHATTMAEAAADGGVGRIVYLGGLHPDDESRWSTHLASRIEVGRILLDGPVPTLVLQAGIVIGSGSASFELLRHLTDRLPVMTTPRWVTNRIQPVAIRDVVHYLSAAATAPLAGGLVRDIGGPDVLTYGDVMQTYAEVAGLVQRRMIVLRPLSPGLASRWVRLVTSIPPGLARPLLESLSNDAVVDPDRDVHDTLPAPPGGPMSYRDAVSAALFHPGRGEARPRWSTSDPVGRPAAPLPTDPDWSGEVVRTQQAHRAVDGPVDLAVAAGRLTDIGWRLQELAPEEGGDLGPVLTWAGTDLPGHLHLRLRAGTDDRGRPLVGARMTWVGDGLAGLLWWPASWPWRTRRLDDVLDLLV